MTPRARYANRELSLLDFQERVLALAENPNLPVLERVKFVAILASNLDEFFQVRVAGLAEQAAAGIEVPSPDGLTPVEQLDAIRKRVEELTLRRDRLFASELIPHLADEEIVLADWADLSKSERKALRGTYESEIHPMLTPLALGPSHPFPFISNLSLNLAVVVRRPKSKEHQFARVKVPALLPRFMHVPGRAAFVPVEQVIAAHAGLLFPGMKIVSHDAFRVTRSAELAIEEEADDLLEAMETILQRRHRFSRIVRLEVASSMPDEVVDLLADEMAIDHSKIYRSTTYLDLAELWTIYDQPRTDLKEPPWRPVTQPQLAADSIFDAISDGDILVHLPYADFRTSIGRFISEAARDPQVLAIKQTLYRTADPVDPGVGGEQGIVRSLMAAARAGKQVAVLVELKARFDEEANIAWARMLEEAGVHVVYGVPGLKTHAKIALVVRREAGGLRRYSHIGTGNYNPKTARIYEDLGLLTADAEIGADLSELFNTLTGYSTGDHYRKLWVAPQDLKKNMLEAIAGQARKGGRIIFKVNHLADTDIIDALYEAAAKGASVDLITRGVCCLIPGAGGSRGRIKVRSIVGRYLEHSRIYRFGDEDPLYLLGSADLMPRNLGGRVEALAPIEDPTIQARLDEVLRVNLADDTLAWELDKSGQWNKVETAEGMNAHIRFQEIALNRAAGAKPDPESAEVATDVIVAAGGILLRTKKNKTETLLIHRPRWDDWSFPKGKLAKGETELEGAIREVEEETGYIARPSREVGSIEYRNRYGRRKVVRYWVMTPKKGSFKPNDEVDEARWLPIPDALKLLSYDRDRALLRSVMAVDG